MQTQKSFSFHCFWDVFSSAGCFSLWTSDGLCLHPTVRGVLAPSALLAPAGTGQLPKQTGLWRQRSGGVPITAGCDIRKWHQRQRLEAVCAELAADLQFTAQQVTHKHTAGRTLCALRVFVEISNTHMVHRKTPLEQKITFKGQKDENNWEGTANTVFSAASGSTHWNPVVMMHAVPCCWLTARTWSQDLQVNSNLTG